MRMVEVIDWKGDAWSLCYLHSSRYLYKAEAYFKAWWHVVEGPAFLHTNGACYDEIPTPIFTEWWT